LDLKILKILIRFN